MSGREYPMFLTMRILIAIFCLCVLPATGASTALAASTEWVDLGGGKARLLALADPAGDQLEAVLEVELEPGWKTYWREPSGPGIPPMFDFARSRGIAFDEPRFPVPGYLEAGGAKFAGYKNTVRFLFKGRRMIAGADAEIGLDVMIGVCEEICIPATASFTLTGAELRQSDLWAMQAIASAREKLPAAPNEEMRIVDLSRIDDLTLRVEAKVPPDADAADLFVEAPAGWYVAPAKLLSMSVGVATFELPAEKGSSAANGKARFRLTLSIGEQSVEQQMTLSSN